MVSCLGYEYYSSITKYIWKCRGMLLMLCYMILKKSIKKNMIQVFNCMLINVAYTYIIVIVNCDLIEYNVRVGKKQNKVLLSS